ncbi:hypothetical protein LCGC14_1145550 [marine sediment metagenome]|uniref:Uncharacterized protein n=1 Tax=marine sediment metagenome TaxID=412755 RepID=A0A0F9M1U3_9ZZZZ
MIDVSNPGAVGIQISNDGKKIWVCFNGVAMLRAQGIEYLQLDDMRDSMEPIEMFKGDEPITLFEGMEIYPTLSLDEMHGTLLDQGGVIVNRFSDSILKILDTTADPRRYFDLEYAVPAVGQQAQRLIKVTEYRQSKLWIMP